MLCFPPKRDKNYTDRYPLAGGVSSRHGRAAGHCALDRLDGGHRRWSTGVNGAVHPKWSGPIQTLAGSIGGPGRQVIDRARSRPAAVSRCPPIRASAAHHEQEGAPFIYCELAVNRSGAARSPRLLSSITRHSCRLAGHARRESCAQSTAR